MERSKNVKIILFAVALVLVTLSSNIFAQGYWCDDGNYGMSWWNTDLPSQYRLSSDQVAELNEYRADYDQKIIPLQKELRALQIEMRGYVNRNDADPSTAKDYRTQIRNLQDEIADFRFEARKKMNDIFKEDQLVYLNDSRVSWWDGFYGRCGWDYEDMLYDSDYGYNGRAGKGRGCW